MADDRPHQTQRGLSAHSIAHVRHFNQAQNRSLAKEDAIGNLLNDAVAVHIDRESHMNPDDTDDESEVSAILRKKLEELDASRKEFSKYLTAEQKRHIAKSSNTTQATLAIIDSATFDWCSRSASGRGPMAKVKSTFHKVCTSLDQHAGLLSMLPRESEYVSVFYGALNSIVAASVMHQAMATGLPRIVDELNAIVSDVAKKIELYPQAKRQMKRVLIELYTRIFGLFTRLMKWYASNNHRWKLTKKDCYNDFQQDLQSIRTWVDLVNKGAWNNLVLEMRHARDDHRESLEEEYRIQHRFRQDMLDAADKFYKLQQNAVMQQAVQQEQLALLSSVAYKESVAELVVEKFMQHFKSVGASQTGILTSMMVSGFPNYGHVAANTGIGQLRDSNEGYRPTTQAFLLAVGDDTATLAPTSSALSMADSEQQSREDVERYSRILDDWYPEGLMYSAHTGVVSTSRPALHESIAARVVHWIRGAESRVLCIQLPYNQNQTSGGSDIASYVVSSAWEASHPIISHFCLLPRTVPGDRSPQTVALCEMMFSLIRQLVALLPSVLPETAVVLDEARFTSLDGTLRTWDSMLALFADLLLLVEQSLLVVISGLQRLDGQVTTPLVENLLAVIRRRIEDQDRSMTQTVKVLFVTEGQARAVVPWLRPGEYSVYEGVQRSARPGASA